MQALALGFGAASVFYGGIAKYVNWATIGANLLMLILGFIGLFINDARIAGIYSLIVALGVLILVELPIDVIQKEMYFFNHNLIIRGLMYILLAIPTFFSVVTLCGGLALLLCGAAYVFCWWRGETGAYTPAPGRDAEDSRSLLAPVEDEEDVPTRRAGAFKLTRDTSGEDV